jgi:cytochrome b6
MKRAINQLLDFITERVPFEKMDFRAMITKKDVPIHRMSWAYYAGGMVLFAFLVQVCTGLMLLFYYKPTVSDAHESVAFLTEHVNMGALIRNLHTWSASFMLLAVIIHLLSSFAMKSFEKPREISWLSGVMLLLVTYAFGFTGYLLPWNQIAVNATKVVFQSIEQVGQLLPSGLAHIPGIIRATIQGEPTIGQATLSRFFALHVVVLPFCIVLILGLHLLLIQLHGISEGVDTPSVRRERFFPYFILKDFSEWGIAFLILFALALCLPFESFFPYPLAEPYNALGATPEGIKPEWYFYFVYYPMEMLPFWVIVVGSNIGLVLLLLTPWIFRGTSRKTLTTLAILAGGYVMIMTIFGSTIFRLIKGG